MTQGLLHYYYGRGKGKTTAALGFAIRSAGSGQKVVIVQFLKACDSGELSSLRYIPNITVFRGKASGGVFFRDMRDEEKAETKKIHENNFRKAIKIVDNGDCDLLILDEAVDACTLGSLDIEMFEKLILDKPKQLELVVTGHGTYPLLLEKADYVTEMVKHKHPFDQGIPARRGVEF